MAETMGELVRRARMEKGWTLRTAAAQLDLPPSYLSDIENDRRLPSKKAMDLFVAHLGLTREDLDQLDGRLDADLRVWAEKNPDVRHLLRQMKNTKLDPAKARKKLFDEDEDDG